jgi:hypothetical protein
MLGAIIIVPTFYSILRPRVATALLTEEQKEAIRVQKETDELRDTSTSDERHAVRELDSERERRL